MHRRFRRINNINVKKETYQHQQHQLENIVDRIYSWFLKVILIATPKHWHGPSEDLRERRSQFVETKWRGESDSIFIICTIRGGACHLIRRDCSHKVAPASKRLWAMGISKFE